MTTNPGSDERLRAHARAVIAAYDEWVNADADFGSGHLDVAIERLREAALADSPGVVTDAQCKDRSESLTVARNRANEAKLFPGLQSVDVASSIPESAAPAPSPISDQFKPLAGEPIPPGYIEGAATEETPLVGARDEVIEEVAAFLERPYSPDVFTPLSDEEVAEAVAAMGKVVRNASDRLHASSARHWAGWIRTSLLGAARREPGPAELTVEQVHKAIRDTQEPWSATKATYYQISDGPALCEALNAALRAAGPGDRAMGGALDVEPSAAGSSMATAPSSQGAEILVETLRDWLASHSACEGVEMIRKCTLCFQTQIALDRAERKRQ
jgi:hypothetical protein